MKQEALKLLQDVVADLNYIINEDGYGSKTIEEDKFQAEHALKAIRAAIFMETPTPSLKFNLYDFTDDMDGTRPIMGCVHHEDGFKVASDSHVLVAVKDAYQEDLEGKNINKKGEEETLNYPKWKLIFDDKQKEAGEYRIDFDLLSGWAREYAAEKKMMGKRGARPGFVKVGPAYFKLELLSKFAKFMKAEGVDTLHIQDSRRAAACFAEDGSKGLIMPALVENPSSDKVMIWEAA